MKYWIEVDDVIKLIQSRFQKIMSEKYNFVVCVFHNMKSRYQLSTKVCKFREC